MFWVQFQIKHHRQLRVFRVKNLCVASNQIALCGLIQDLLEYFSQPPVIKHSPRCHTIPYMSLIFCLNGIIKELNNTHFNLYHANKYIMVTVQITVNTKTFQQIPINS